MEQDRRDGDPARAGAPGHAVVVNGKNPEKPVC